MSSRPLNQPRSLLRLFRLMLVMAVSKDDVSDLLRTNNQQLIQKWPSSKESWVEGGYDVIQSRHQNKRGYFRMQKRIARFMFYPSSCVFVYACLGKDYAV